MRLATLSWPDVEKYLKTKTDLILPIGSTEQHGPTGLIGTDHLTADAIALGVGEKLQILVAPPLCYGMASHHMAFAGSATLRPSLYQAVLSELFRGFYSQGFRRFHVVNGHGGNEFSVRSVFQEMKHEKLSDASFSFFNWWKIPQVVSLAEELYGNQEGFHATPSEVSLTFYLHGIERRAYSYQKQEVRGAWPLTAEEMRKTFPDGVIGANPGLALPEHGKRFFETAVDGIAAEIKKQI